ncbi:uncharacterized protein [Vicugna pacos]|uniref:Uncharacterized protein isoform X2 n=1 Tax=Vicugna pacos TaxID=30538 RepID=A0ABM5CGN5_VICPA
MFGGRILQVSQLLGGGRGAVVCGGGGGDSVKWKQIPSVTRGSPNPAAASPVPSAQRPPSWSRLICNTTPANPGTAEVEARIGCGESEANPQAPIGQEPQPEGPRFWREEEGRGRTDARTREPTRSVGKLGGSWVLFAPAPEEEGIFGTGPPLADGSADAAGQPLQVRVPSASGLRVLITIWAINHPKLTGQ